MRPTDLELAAALAEAEARRDAGDDPAFLAHSLLYLYRRNALLEGVREHVQLFLKFGMPAEEHAKLVRLLEELEAFDRDETSGDEGHFGL